MPAVRFVRRIAGFDETKSANNLFIFFQIRVAREPIRLRSQEYRVPRFESECDRRIVE